MKLIIVLLWVGAVCFALIYLGDHTSVQARNYGLGLGFVACFMSVLYPYFRPSKEHADA